MDGWVSGWLDSKVDVFHIWKCHRINAVLIFTASIG